MSEEVKELAYSKWKKAGCPEGHDLDFWLAAESEIKRNTIYENLKLPICPKCGDTKYVVEMDVAVLLVPHTIYPWFICETCVICWHAKEGIREKDDHRVCFG